MSKQYETVIGLEVHVELATKTKIFCSYSTQFGGAPNTHTCPIYTGMPGSLPVLNKQVMEYALVVGLAASYQISQYCKFDRKNCFYPDNPQNYQISQLYLPVCHDGWVDIETESGLKGRVGVHEIHMEEGASKLIHDEQESCSLVGYNRSEVPLVEIMSEPDVRSAEEIIAYLKKLRLITQYLGVSDCKLQEGSMRTDVNLSMREAGAAEFGTRTEMKDLNSLKAITGAIGGECRRQIELLEDGREVVQETWRWGDGKEGSRAMQSKEDAQGYRYLPDPDLVPVIISDEQIIRMKARQPELHTEKIAKYMEEYSLPEYNARLLTSSRHMADIFKETTRLSGQPKKTSNWLMVEAVRLMKEQEMEPEDMRFSPAHLTTLIGMVEKSTINRTMTKIVFEEIFGHDADPEAYAEEKGLKVIRDEGTLRCTIEAVMAANPQSVGDYKSDKEKAMGFLVGQTMKAMEGRAGPAMMNQLIRELFDGEDA